MYKTLLIVGFIIAVFVTAISAGYLVQLLV